MREVVAVVLILASTPAEAACHHFTIWKNPWPQHCPPSGRSWLTAQARAPTTAPAPFPPSKPLDVGDSIPLPDITDGDQWGDTAGTDRLKGIGLLREYWGTN